MNAGLTHEFIAAIPKSDLHIHLDGSIRLETLLALADEMNVALPSQTPEGLLETVFKESYADLPEYLRAFACTCAVLTTPDALTRVARELVEDVLAEGVRYMEVRFAPQLHACDGFDMIDVLRAVDAGLAEGAQAHNRTDAVRQNRDIPFRYGIIACAMRTFTRQMGAYFARLITLLPETPRRELVAIASEQVARAAVTARDREGLPIVGFDLAGEEAGYPAAYHKVAYQYAHSHFMRKTVHAGEAYGPESIFQAITDCHANRIGHGTFLFEARMIQDPLIPNPATFVDALAEYIASQRIAVEVCLTSNRQTIPALADLAAHPVRQMLAHNLSVTLCTDNRLVSRTSLTRELEIFATTFPISRYQFRNAIIAGFKGSFFPGSYNEKRTYVRRVRDRYDDLANRLLSPISPPADEDPGDASIA